MSRSYGQYCGLARALEVVGERWNLLIVRQLLIGPARYGDLQRGLPGVATNLLADRLKDLEAAGVLQRRLGEDANVVTYELTPWGAQLREPIEGLVRWSEPMMVQGPREGDHVRAEWLLVALPGLFAGRRYTGKAVTVHLEVEGELVQVRATRSGIQVGPADGRSPDAVVRADYPIVLGLSAGALALDDVRELVDIEGDEAVVHRLFATQDKGVLLT